MRVLEWWLTSNMHMLTKRSHLKCSTRSWPYFTWSCPWHKTSSDSKGSTDCAGEDQIKLGLVLLRSARLLLQEWWLVYLCPANTWSKSHKPPRLLIQGWPFLSFQILDLLTALQAHLDMRVRGKFREIAKVLKTSARRWAIIKKWVVMASTCSLCQNFFVFQLLESNQNASHIVVLLRKVQFRFISALAN